MYRSGKIEGLVAVSLRLGNKQASISFSICQQTHALKAPRGINSGIINAGMFLTRSPVSVQYRQLPARYKTSHPPIIAAVFSIYVTRTPTSFQIVHMPEARLGRAPAILSERRHDIGSTLLFHDANMNGLLHQQYHSFGRATLLFGSARCHSMSERLPGPEVKGRFLRRWA
jgi:hypothetical protein